MNWKLVINSAPLGSGDLSGGYAPRKKEWIGLALAGASLASSIFGGIQSSKAQKEAERKLANEKAANEAWYNRRYNEHTIDTAAGQNMIRMAKDYARETWKKASGAAAVGGGTDADVAAAKEAGTKMVGNAIAQIEAQDVARKDNVDATYRAEKSRLTQQQMALDQQRAANISSVAGGISDALMTGAMMTAGSKGIGKGSPGGAGVTAASQTPALEKMGINTNEDWLKKKASKLYDYRSNYDYLSGLGSDFLHTGTLIS